MPNPRRALRPGAFAKADIVVAGRCRAWSPCPRTAVVTFAGVEKVLTVDKDKAAERRVQTGRRLGDQVEILRPDRRAAGRAAGPATSPRGQPVTSAVSAAGSLALAVQKLAEICIRRPVFAAMLILALVVVGAAGYARLGVDRFPAVDLPTVSVRTELPGASAEEVETEVSQRDRGGRQHRRRASTSCGRSPGRASRSSSSTFNLERDIDVAAQDVREPVAHRHPQPAARRRRRRSSPSSTTTRRRCSRSRCPATARCAS